MVAGCQLTLEVREAAGSNPAVPTISHTTFFVLFFLGFFLLGLIFLLNSEVPLMAMLKGFGFVLGVGLDASIDSSAI